ncbi:hypothetical protein HAX54_014970 [Datura stramonium]|uniref:VQ domain-containing protein n=1 Tax=Datura stramonium TaxID=4076 RepID=A0ABS8TNV8_DATST|nr:hypothetical protein [Datura stramonium]
MNNNIIPTSPTHQWMDSMQMPYNYQQREFGQANTPYENFSQLDSTIMTATSPLNYMTTYPSSSDYHYSNISPDNSSGNRDDPKTTNSVSSKPVRRRSRASKKTPTTLVNASISNFRAVVQQYTGFHTCPIKNQKGPINLSFGPQTDDANIESSSIGEASQYGYYYNTQDQMNDSPAGYSISGTSMFGVEDYGSQR